jgi:8-oxo-dGTP pyrophosphatase MutT (NUDIX family)
MFVHRRTDTKDVYPGYWDVTIGGVVGTGEDYDTAARREVEEEVGLTTPRLTALFPMTYEDQDTRVRGAVYECVSDEPLRLQVEEIAEGRWVCSDDLEALISGERICPDALAVFRSYASFRASSKGCV